MLQIIYGVVLSAYNWQYVQIWRANQIALLVRCIAKRGALIANSPCLMLCPNGLQGFCRGKREQGSDLH